MSRSQHWVPTLMGYGVASLFGAAGLCVAAQAQDLGDQALADQTLEGQLNEVTSVESERNSPRPTAAVPTDTEISATTQPSPTTSPVTAAPLTLAQRRVQILDLALIPQDMSPSESLIAAGLAVTSETLSDTDMTAPSLWWQQDKASEIGPLNGRSMVTGWVAHYRPADQQHHVDVAINGQIWNLLNYLEQYAFITQFGQAAKAYGYHLRVFNGSRLVGGYICGFDQTLTFSQYETIPADDLNSIACTVELDYLGRGAISGRSSR